ncbi:MAG: N-acyl amino acid synthase FeeM domain-containing protein [Rhizobacter sp.]
MNDSAETRPTRRIPRLARAALGGLPRETRFALFRRMVDCNPAPDLRLSLGIASTQDELEGCFALLHDAYVASGFMKPDPSGLRVTPYHALPTTTTLFAKFDEQIVGTLSIIREGVFGFPMQSAFDLTAVRAQPGRIAEISALAVHPSFRDTGGTILFPLMKFMYEYCTAYFDTRHLVIAVNPKHIEMYEALLFFQRLQADVVNSYDFANGAPAVGATLDLKGAPGLFHEAYEGRRPNKNLHHYFTKVTLPNIRFPERTYFTTNDPVMSPALLDHFFNHRTRVFQQLDERRRRLLKAIYHEEIYGDVLPFVVDGPVLLEPLRRHRRYSLKCPARLDFTGEGGSQAVELEVIDASLNGFLARAKIPLPDQLRGFVSVQLGLGLVATTEAVVVRCISAKGGPYFGFRVENPGNDWRRSIEGMEQHHTVPGTLSRTSEVADASEEWSIHDAEPNY